MNEKTSRDGIQDKESGPFPDNSGRITELMLLTLSTTITVRNVAVGMRVISNNVGSSKNYNDRIIIPQSILQLTIGASKIPAGNTFPIFERFYPILANKIS